MKKIFIFILFYLGFSIGVYAQDFLKDINFGKYSTEVSHIIRESKKYDIKVFIPVEVTEDEIKLDSVIKIGLYYTIGEIHKLQDSDKYSLCESLIHNYRFYEDNMTYCSCEHIPVIGFILTDGIGLAYITISLSDKEWTIDYKNCQVFHERFAEPKKIYELYKLFMLKYFSNNGTN